MAINTKTPLKYIEDYYIQDEKDDFQYKEVNLLHAKTLKYVKGKRVLNAGCGPQLYDDLFLFEKLPEEYVGADINKNTFEFLENSENSRLKKAKKFAKENNVKTQYFNGNIFELEKLSKKKFDAIIGSGFFGTFEKDNFKNLMNYLGNFLKKGGRLVDVAWYEPFLSNEEIERKKIYNFETFKGPNELEAIAYTEQAGFKTIFNEIIEIKDKKDYGWGKVQGCVFEKIGGKSVTL